MEKFDNIDEIGDREIYPLFSDSLPTGVFVSSVCDILLKVHTRSQRFQDGLFCDDTWPGSVVLSHYISQNDALVNDKIILELGAGSALPSLVCLKLNAKTVVITDYPGESVIENIRLNVIENGMQESMDKCNRCIIRPFIWGEDISSILPYDENNCLITMFDVILLPELLWADTYTQHSNLLKSIVELLSPGGSALASFAHRPTETHPTEKDMEFFIKAEKDFGLSVNLIASYPNTRDVGGDDMVTVFLYRMNKL